MLAVVEVNGGVAAAMSLRRLLQCEPDFAVTSVNYELTELLCQAEVVR